MLTISTMLVGAWAGSQFSVGKRERSGLPTRLARFIVRLDEQVTAFLDLQRATYEFAVSLIV